MKIDDSPTLLTTCRKRSIQMAMEKGGSEYRVYILQRLGDHNYPAEQFSPWNGRRKNKRRERLDKVDGSNFHSFSKKQHRMDHLSWSIDVQEAHKHSNLQNQRLELKKKSVIDSPPHWVKWRVFVFLHFTEYTLGGWCFASNTQPFTHLMEIDFVGCFFFVFFAFSRGLIYKHNNTNGFFVFSFHLLLLLLLQTLFHTSLSLLLSQSVFIYIIISEPTNWNADFIASRSTDTTRFTAFDFFLARFFFLVHVVSTDFK